MLHRQRRQPASTQPADSPFPARRHRGRYWWKSTWRSPSFAATSLADAQEVQAPRSRERGRETALFPATLPSPRSEGRATVWAVKLFFLQAEDGIRDESVTQTCALPI